MWRTLARRMLARTLERGCRPKDCAGRNTAATSTATTAEMIERRVIFDLWLLTSELDALSSRIVTRSSLTSATPKVTFVRTKGTSYPVPGTCTTGYVVKKSTIAFFITSRPTSLIDFVKGISFGQTSTQF